MGVARWATPMSSAREQHCDPGAKSAAQQAREHPTKYLFCLHRGSQEEEQVGQERQELTGSDQLKTRYLIETSDRQQANYHPIKPPPSRKPSSR